MHQPVLLGQRGRRGKSILVPSALEATEKPLLADVLQNTAAAVKDTRVTQEASGPVERAAAAAAAAAGLRPAVGRRQSRRLQLSREEGLAELPASSGTAATPEPLGSFP